MVYFFKAFLCHTAGAEQEETLTRRAGLLEESGKRLTANGTKKVCAVTNYKTKKKHKNKEESRGGVSTCKWEDGELSHPQYSRG